MDSKKQFYGSAKWLRVRAACLARANYKDQLEDRAGRNIPADTVHHIFPLEKYPEYRLEAWNLIAVSNDTHERLHNRGNGQLSALGWELLLETAEKNNIPISRKILVVGLPGSGKTTFARQHIRQGIAFDADYLMGAFRLRGPHEDKHEGAKKLSEQLLNSFCGRAGEFAGVVWIIRSAPTVEELSNINPDVVIYMKGKHIISHRKDYEKLSPKRLKEMQENLKELIEFCQYNDIELVER